MVVFQSGKVGAVGLARGSFCSCAAECAPAKYLGLSIWPKRRNWVLCIGVTVAFLLVVTLFELAVREKCLSTVVFSQPLTLLLVSLQPGPLLEELFFRGFLMTELLDLLRLSRAVALSSLLFAGIHIVYWLTQGATAQAIATNAAACFAFSLLAGWLFAKTRSIWPSTCARIVNNLLFSMLAVSNV